MFVRNLSTDVQVLPVIANTTVVQNTATYAASAIDMQGYQSIMLVCTSPAQAAANTPILSVNYGSNTTTNTAVASSSVPVGLNTTCQVLELSRPTKRYITPVVTGANLNTVVNVIAILTGREPQALGSGNPVDNMIAQNSSFNTTTGVFGGVSNTLSSSNTPTSKLLLANP